MYCSLAVHLLLFSASYYCVALLPRLGHATGGARVSSTSPRYGRVAAAASNCDIGWISAQRGGRCDWSVVKKTGSMHACRRWSLRTLAVTLLAWHSSCTHNNRFFSEPSVFERTQQTFSQMKNFCISQVCVVTFSGGVGKWATVFFLK